MNIDRAIAEEIIGRIANGEPLRAILRSDERFPSHTWFYKWLEVDAELKAMFQAARDAGFDVIAEDCLEIADDARNDWMERQGEDGQGEGFQLNGEHIQRSKLRIETRLKLLAKWDPRRYGEKIDLNHGGTVAANVTVCFRDPEPSGADASD